MTDKDLQRQTCKECGRKDKFNFQVDDAVWDAVVPPSLRNCVICLYCFDEMADRSGQRYHEALRSLFFAGDKASFEFTAKWGVE
tara:strand:+ start:97 stop:348 length:252 start_codon:yes stop_codon:yes gene_type:complete